MQETETTSTEDWTALLASFLRGGPALWQGGWDPEQVADQVRYHGIALALVESDCDLSSWPASALEPVQEEARLQALWEASHRQLLERVLQAFAQSGIEARLLKGTAVSYLGYENPAARRRGDSDLLVRSGREADAAHLLQNLGLKRHGPASFGQQNWLFDTGMGFFHAIDLHSRLVASPYLCEALDEAKFWEDPVALPRLSPLAQTVPCELLLLRGVINQALHKVHGYYHDGERVHDGERLIWVMDLAVLMRQFGADDWERLVRAAVARGLASLCLEGLQKAAALLDAPLPQSIEAELSAASGASPIEHYMLRASLGARIRMDWQSLELWSDRFRLIRRHALPDAEALQSRFPDQAHWPVPLLHAKRIPHALRKRIRAWRVSAHG